MVLDFLSYESFYNILLMGLLVYFAQQQDKDHHGAGEDQYEHSHKEQPRQEPTVDDNNALNCVLLDLPWSSGNRIKKILILFIIFIVEIVVIVKISQA